MRKVRMIVALCLGLASTQASSQGLDSLRFHVAYFSQQGLHPGAKLGVQLTLLEAPKVKNKRNGKEKTKLRNLGVESNLGFYRHAKSHVGVFHNYHLSYRKTGHNQYFIELGAGPGLYRSFLPEAYEVDEGGQVHKKTLAGHFYFAPSAFIGFGKQRPSDKALDRWHVRLSTLYLMNYASTNLPLLNLEFGLHFNRRR